ncbi:MAG: hypothetical protein ACE5Q6_08745 [Dehalococcoidia bacterium]
MEYGELGGVICPGCGDEVFRILEGKCMRCLNGRKKQSEEKWERKTLIRHLRRKLRRGGGYEGETLARK